MKVPLFIGLAVLFAFSTAMAAVPAAEAKKPAKAAPTPGVELAGMVAQVTGIAISPLLGVSAVGAYRYFVADTPEEKARLPWFSNPAVWTLGLLIVVACAVKDGMGAATPPGWKKPLDLLELAENKLSALVATGAVIPILVATATKYLGEGTDAGIASGGSGALAMLPIGAVDFSWALNILMVPLSIVVFLVVWIASHAISVLILLSPWGAVDAALKAARTAVLGLVTATAYIDPVVGATLSAVIIIFAYFVAGWAFRLTIFGTVFTWDFLTFRRHRFAPAPDGNWVFTGRETGGAPIRTYGRLRKTDGGGLTLAYRPWLVMPEKTAKLPTEGLAMGRGFFWPTVEFLEKGNDLTLLTLPPRYKGHEAEFGSVYGIREIREVGLRRGWQILRQLFSSQPAISA